jgi:hypothetical protein
MSGKPQFRPPAAFVLDGYHVTTDPSIDEGISFKLEVDLRISAVFRQECMLVWGLRS